MLVPTFLLLLSAKASREAISEDFIPSSAVFLWPSQIPVMHSTDSDKGAIATEES